MTKRISFLFLLVIFSFQIHAQSVFYGLTSGGNVNSTGTISKYDPATNSLTTAYSFKNQDGGSAPVDLEFVEGVDGKLYGTTKKGGIHHVGVLFSFNPSTNSYEKLYDLPNTPTGVLTKGNGSMIYGTTDDHIFSFNTATRAYTIRYVFTSATGSGPLSGLTLAADNKFYGTTSMGGANSKGVIYRFDTTSNAYTKLLDFTGVQGACYWGLTLGAGNLLYGTTINGSISSAGSMLFSFDPNTSALQDLFHFTSETASAPTKRLTSGNDGKLYGVSYQGPELYGSFFSYDAATNKYTAIWLGDPADNYNTNHFTSSPTIGTDGKLYGFNNGGDHSDGLIYSYDPNTKIFSAAYSFNDPPTHENKLTGKLIQASNGKFYAAIIPGIISDTSEPQGKLFSFNPMDNTVDYVYYFHNNPTINGSKPYNSLVKGNGDELFGMTAEGGNYDLGVVFSYNPASEVYTKLHDFNGADGGSPLGNLIYAPNGKIYGATTNGGPSGGGVLFSLDPSNKNFNKLYDFTHDDGFYPYGSLIEGNDNKLYGTTHLGGVSNGNGGVLFSFDLSNNTYSKLFEFTEETGTAPTGITRGPGNKFYGVTWLNGANGSGTIFSFDPSTNVFTKEYDFNNADGGNPQGELFLASNGKLYGLAGGGTGGSGVIFSFDPTTNLYTKLYNFTGGEQPFGTLTQDNNGLLYGMTVAGGGNTLGVVFSYNVNTNIYTKLQDFDGTNGGHPYYGSLIKVSPKTSYVKVNLYGGTNPYNNPEWNNWNSYSLSSGNFKYSDGSSSSISATLSQQTSIADNGVGYNSTMAPPEAIRYASYSTTTRTLTISGLSNTKIYDLELYASRKGVSNNTTRFNIGSTTIDVFTDNNLTNTASFTSLVPTSGAITVNVSKLNTYNYINGFVLNERKTNQPPVVNAGNDRSITLPTNNVQLNGSSTDADGTITSYNWTKVSGPAQYSFNDPTAPDPLISNLVSGTYVFRLTAYDNQGSSSFDEVTITVNPEVAATKFVKVNLYGGSNPYNHPDWNNWNSYVLSSGTLKYSDGTSSPVYATLSQQSGIADNSTPYITTMAPTEVMRYASYSTADRTLTISGLDNSKTYNLELYASRKGATSNTTRFTIGSQSIDILTDNNSSNKASFASITPAGGQIVIGVSKLNAYNYLNGFVLTENSASPPVTRKAQTNTLEQVLSTSISTYPNPVIDQVVLRINNAYTGLLKVEIIDMRGAVIKQFQLSKNFKGISQNYLPVKDLVRGEYLVRIQTGNQIEVRKLIKL